MSLSVLASCQIYFSPPTSQPKQGITPSERSFELPVFESAKHWARVVEFRSKEVDCSSQQTDRQTNKQQANKGANKQKKTKEEIEKCTSVSLKANVLDKQGLWPECGLIFAANFQQAEKRLC
jgi:hypothetical protein